MRQQLLLLHTSKSVRRRGRGVLCANLLQLLLLLVVAAAMRSWMVRSMCHHHPLQSKELRFIRLHPRFHNMVNISSPHRYNRICTRILIPNNRHAHNRNRTLQLGCNITSLDRLDTLLPTPIRISTSSTRSSSNSQFKALRESTRTNRILAGTIMPMSTGPELDQRLASRTLCIGLTMNVYLLLFHSLLSCSSSNLRWFRRLCNHCRLNNSLTIHISRGGHSR